MEYPWHEVIWYFNWFICMSYYQEGHNKIIDENVKVLKIPNQSTFTKLFQTGYIWPHWIFPSGYTGMAWVWDQIYPTPSDSFIRIQRRGTDPRLDISGPHQMYPTPQIYLTARRVTEPWHMSRSIYPTTIGYIWPSCTWAILNHPSNKSDIFDDLTPQ
jgi:hypothetical protein